MAPPKHTVAADIIRLRLAYDPETGAFIWLRPPVNRPEMLGKVAGHLATTGYRSISIDGQRIQEHRLAWAYVFGAMPKGEIDHINGNRADNRIANLRLATRQQNNCNTGALGSNTSGHKGVSWHKRNHKWNARIQANGCKLHLGYFEKIEDAVAAYAAAAKRLHGEFARLA